MTKQDHKADLALWLQAAYGESFQAEYRFHPTRKWRFDYGWPEIKVAVEFDGLFGGGAHTSINMVAKDSEKMNEAAILGWIVIRVNTMSLRDGSGYDAIDRAVAARSHSRHSARNRSGASWV